MRNTFLRPLLAVLFALSLVGCASLPPQQAYNREAHSIKTITVLEMQPVTTNVFMLHHPGASFGLIGGLVAAADQAGKESKFRALMEAESFEPLPYFRERLDAALTERGYTVIWPANLVQTGKVQRGPYGLRKAYAPSSAADAQMDVNLVFVGYAAAGATAGAPYRPTLTAGVRLVGPDGKQNIYTDYFAHNNVFNVPKAVVTDADPAYSYPKFDDLHNAGPKSVEGLRVALDALARKIAGQM